MRINIGKRILQRRNELNMSQEELAQKVGYKDRSSIARIESGERDIRQKKVIEFAKALKTTPAWLMGYDEPQKENSQDDDILTAFPDLKDFYGDDVHSFFSQHDLTEWIDILVKLDEEQLKQLHQYAEFLKHQKSD